MKIQTRRASFVLSIALDTVRICAIRTTQYARRMTAIVVFLVFSSPAFAANLVVNNFTDASGVKDSLRGRIQEACNTAGADIITFHAISTERIKLNAPIKIEISCGEISIQGPTAQEVILDGSGISSGKGILVLEGYNGTVENLTVEKFSTGAGIALVGNWNTVEGITSSENQTGILIDGDQNALFASKIGVAKGCPALTLPKGSDDILPTLIHELLYSGFPSLGSGKSSSSPKNPAKNCGNGTGILIKGDLNLIGSARPEDANDIFYNKDYGIIIDGGIQDNLMRNRIAYNKGSGIKLINGGNRSAAPLTLLQTLPVETEPQSGNDFSYSVYGEGISGTTSYLYAVPPDEELAAGGSAIYLGEAKIYRGESSFAINVNGKDLVPGTRVTAITCDANDNCSPFAINSYLDRDSDGDLIVDSLEDQDQDNLIKIVGTLVIETDPYLMDSDGDGLADGLEDRNQNGKVDPGETDPRKSDTDGDGLTDYNETEGDGIKDTDETDATVADSDKDGDSDGLEATNRTDPLDAKSNSKS